MATGLLVIGVNAGTKLLTYLVGTDKTYFATFRLGVATNTDDAEGEPIGEPVDARGISTSDLEVAIASLTGDIMQVPSSVSAIKVDGKRAYALVRGGEEVKLQARTVRVSQFDLHGEPRVSADGYFDFDATITCSSGTYIRALARDLGLALKVGGHLTALRRTRVGGYLVESAVSIETANSDAVTPLAEAAQAAFAVRNLSEAEVTDLRHGKRLKAFGIEGDHCAIDEAGNLVAMLTETGGQARSSVVFSDV
jgi:tRNA pseudouridine55 synthase